MPAHYTASDRNHALRLHKEGWGYLRISEVIGCCSSTVMRWVEDAIKAKVPGVKKHPRLNYSEKFKKKAIADYVARSDLSLLKVAGNHGISHHTLSRWLESAGVMTRSTKPAAYSRSAIIEDLKAGMLKKDIAVKHGCSESWVYRVQSGG